MSLNELQELLERGKEHAMRQREETIFSVGGWAHYENPISDLLEFFLKPEEQHRFGSLFLRAFLSCVGKDDISDLSLKGVAVIREHRLDGGRMDFLITGPGWVLVIENKIRHWTANDFEAYGAHAKLHGAAKPWLAILSPDRVEVAGWESITYKEYCAVLRHELATRLQENSPSKWTFFAADLLTYLETLIYGNPMTLDQKQIAFIESNLPQIADLKALLEAYMPVVQKRLDDALAKAVPQHQFSGHEEWWGFCYTEPLRGLRLCFKTKGHPERRFSAGCWQWGLAQTQLTRAHEAFRALHLQYSPEDGGGWDGYYETESEAINGFCDIARQLYLFSAETAA